MSKYFCELYCKLLWEEISIVFSVTGTSQQISFDSCDIALWTSPTVLKDFFTKWYRFYAYWVVVLCCHVFRATRDQVTTLLLRVRDCKAVKCILQYKFITYVSSAFFYTKQSYKVLNMCLCVSVWRSCSWDSVWLLEDGVAGTVSLHRHGDQSGGSWKGKFFFFLSSVLLLYIFSFLITFCLAKFIQGLWQKKLWIRIMKHFEVAVTRVLERYSSILLFNGVVIWIYANGKNVDCLSG